MLKLKACVTTPSNSLVFFLTFYEFFVRILYHASQSLSSPHTASWISDCGSPAFPCCQHQDALSSPCPATSPNAPGSRVQGSIRVHGQFCCSMPYGLISCTHATRASSTALLRQRIWSILLTAAVSEVQGQFYSLVLSAKVARGGGWRAYLPHPCHHLA